jgi:hypothetical protein
MSERPYQEVLADPLDDPLPADWQDPEAVAARQDMLAATASFAGEAALNVLLASGQAAALGARLEPDAPEVSRFGTEMAALLRGLRTYTWNTQRGDGRVIITDALTSSAGATIAALVDGVLDRLIREQ